MERANKIAAIAGAAPIDGAGYGQRIWPTGGKRRGQMLPSVDWMYGAAFISFKLSWGAALSILSIIPAQTNRAVK